MSELKAIIFDLWETIGTKNISISKTFQNNFRITANPDFLQRYETAIQLRKWDRESDAAANLLSEFKIPLTKENMIFVTDLFQQGTEKATLFPGMKDLLHLLSKKYKLGVLSNTTNFESVVLSNWQISKLFSAKVFSWEVNSLKPSSKNFQAICTNLNLQPSECLFIDDVQVNVEAAIIFGMAGKVYLEYEDLLEYLRDNFLININ